MNKNVIINYAEGTRKRKLVLVVDTREGKNDKLFEKIRSRMENLGASDQLEVRRLEIFDFQYVFFDDREKTFGPHIERKTASDTAASITDKRWREQMGRAHGIPNKIHLFEGNLLAGNYSINPKAIIGAVLKPAMRHEFDALMTQNMDATADMLVAWFTYLEHVDDVKVVKDFTYVECFQGQARKRDFRDNERLALMIKDFVFGASAGVANAVVEKYGSLGVLQAAFLANSERTLREVAELPYIVDDKFNKVGKAVAKKIYSDLCDIDVLRAALESNAVNPREEEDDDYNDNNNNARKKRKTAIKLPMPRGSKKSMQRPLKEIPDEIEEFPDEDEDRELYELLQKVESDIKKK